MALLTIDLPDELDSFVHSEVKAGHFSSASAVIQEAIFDLRAANTSDEAKMVALRAAIAEGDASVDAEGDVFEHVRKTLNLPAFDAE